MNLEKRIYYVSKWTFSLTHQNSKTSLSLKCYTYEDFDVKGTYRGCQITSLRSFISGGFVGQVKPQRGSQNCGFVLGLAPPPSWFQKNLLDRSNRGGGEI